MERGEKATVRDSANKISWAGDLWQKARSPTRGCRSGRRSQRGARAPKLRRSRCRWPGGTGVGSVGARGGADTGSETARRFAHARSSCVRFGLRRLSSARGEVSAGHGGLRLAGRAKTKKKPEAKASGCEEGRERIRASRRRPGRGPCCCRRRASRSCRSCAGSRARHCASRSGRPRPASGIRRTRG